MEAPQKSASKQMNGTLTETCDQRRMKNRLFVSKVAKRASGEPTNSVRGDRKELGMATEASAKQRGIQTSSGFYMSGRLMAEGAKKLTQEEMAALEIDIFKPLDFYEILVN